MTTPDLLVALGPVVDQLEVLGVRYYVGGSLASSAHGVPRASIDADVVADLDSEHVERFVAQLKDDYYIDEGRVRSAVLARRSFNAIHLATMFKIDVFIAKGRPFDDQALQRARPRALDDAPGARLFVVASPEDTIIAKLECFRLGGETSDRQWSDIVGMMKTRPSGLDDEYLERWTRVLGVEDLLEGARKDSRAT